MPCRSRDWSRSIRLLPLGSWLIGAAEEIVQTTAEAVRNGYKSPGVSHKEIVAVRQVCRRSDFFKPIFKVPMSIGVSISADDLSISSKVFI